MDGTFGEILDLLTSLGPLLAGVFYLSIVLWTYKDARKRIEDPILVATATATSMLPIVGVFVYMLLRPSEYLADVRERELEIRMMERQLGRQERCPSCKSHIEGDYLTCPVCTTKLRQECISCDRPLDPRWVMCPYCEAEVPGRARRTPAPTAGGSRGGSSSRPERESSREAAGRNAQRAGRSGGRERPGGDKAPKRSSSSDRVEKPARATGGTTSGEKRPASKDRPRSSEGGSSKQRDGLEVEPFGPDPETSRFVRSDTLASIVTTTRPVTDR